MAVAGAQRAIAVNLIANFIPHSFFYLTNQRHYLSLGSLRLSEPALVLNRSYRDMRET